MPPIADLRDVIKRRNAITEDVAREVHRLLLAASDDLERILVRAGSQRAAEREIRRLLQRLYRDLASAIRDGSHLTAADVETAYIELTGRLVAQAGVPGMVMDSGPAIAAATRILQGNGRWSSMERLLAGHMGRTQVALLNALAAGARDGRGGREIARDMRRILVGEASDAIERAAAAGRKGPNLRYLTERIAISSINNAHHAAHVESAIRSPVVKALKWHTNSWRGATSYDVCNELALQDFYGLGEGVYKLGSVPDKPHPFCKCYTTSILVDVSRGEMPSYDKPDPARRYSADRAVLSAPRGATDALQARVRRELKRVVEVDIRTPGVGHTG